MTDETTNDATTDRATNSQVDCYTSTRERKGRREDHKIENRNSDTSKTAEPLSEVARQEAGPGLARSRCDRSDCSLKSGTQPFTQRFGNVSHAGVTRVSPADLCAL